MNEETKKNSCLPSVVTQSSLPGRKGHGGHGSDEGRDLHGLAGSGGES